VIGGVAATFGDHVPFLVVAAMAAANVVIAWVRLPESRPIDLPQPGWPELRRALVPTPIRLIAAVHERRIGLYLYLFLHLFTAFAVLEALVTYYLGERFHKDALQVSAVFAWIGVVIFLTQGVALRRLVARVGETRLVALGLVSMAAGLVGIALVPSYAWIFPLVGVIAFGNGIAFPTFTSLYSRACEAENAGEMLGQSQAMATTGRILGPWAGGLIMQQYGLGIPFIVAGIMMLVALAIFGAARRTLVEGLS
jgi:predicted MFS family arabinose efflux permease